MRTFGYRTITKSLPVGIRRFAKNATNRPGLSSVYNLVPTEAGLASPDLPGFPPTANFDSNTIEITWPLPQLVAGGAETLAIFQDSVFRKVGVGESGWSFEPVPIMNAYDPTSAGSIVGRDIWHSADHGESFLLTNGHTCLFRTPLLGKMWGYSTDLLLANNATPFNTCCVHRGRTILGGFSESTWTSSWRTLFETWAADLNSDLHTPDYSLDRNMVMWSPVGGNIYWLFYASTVATEGFYGSGEGYDSTRTYVMDLFRKNDLGWMALPFSGQVLRVAPLGRYLVAYGTNGSVPLTPITGEINTYGMVDGVGPGTLRRGSVGVSPSAHLYIDSDGYLRYKTIDLAEVRLGYQEIFSDDQWLSKNTVISWNESAKEWYIANGQQGFCLKMSEDGRQVLGLGETNHLYTSVHEALGRTYGIYDRVGHDDAVFISNELTFETEGIKTLQSVDVAVKGADPGNAISTLVRIHYKYDDRQEDFDVGEWVPCNEQGQAVVQKAGKRFMVEIAVASDGRVEIDRCDVWVQHNDVRFRRGVYVD